MSEKHKLILRIVNDHFGIFVEAVAKELLLVEKALFYELRQKLKSFTVVQVKNSLLVGLQHSLFDFSYDYVGKTQRLRTYYFIDEENIIARTRIPKYISHVKQLFGDEAEIIMEELILSGRVTLSLFIEHVKSCIVELFSLTGQTFDDGQILTRVRELVSSLIQQAYIKKVIVKDSMKPQPNASQARISRNSTQTKPVGSEPALPEQNQSNTKHVSLQALKSRSLRPLMRAKKTNIRSKRSESLVTKPESISNSQSGVVVIEDDEKAKTKPPRKSKRNSQASQKPSKRQKTKRDSEPSIQKIPEPTEKNQETIETFDPNQPIAMEIQIMMGNKKIEETPAEGVNAETDPNLPSILEEVMPVAQEEPNVQELGLITNDEDLWTFNFPRFVVDFRKQACIKFVTEKIDYQGGEIFRILFEMVQPKALKKEITTCVVLDQDLFKELKKQQIGITQDRLNNYLDLMSKERTQILIKIPVGDSVFEYAINLPSIVDIIRQKYIESIIDKKFESPSLRIFRLLLLKKQLEQKQVSDFSMIPIEETRMRLYTMWAEKFLHLQEVPGDSAHTPERTLYLWSVRWKQVCDIINEKIHKAIFNIMTKIEMMTTKFQDLLSKKEQEERYAEQGEEIQILTDEERQSFDKIEGALRLLEAEVLNLSEEYMILHDF